MVSASSALRYSWLALGDVEEGWRLSNLVKSHGIHSLVYCVYLAVFRFPLAISYKLPQVANTSDIFTVS